MIKKGKLRGTATNPDNKSRRISEYTIYEENVFDTTAIYVMDLTSEMQSNDGSGWKPGIPSPPFSSTARVYYGEDLTSSDFIKNIIVGGLIGWTQVYEWLTPMTAIKNPDDKYPVGAIFTTVLPHLDPNVEFGGTWVKYDESNKIEWLRTA